MSADALLNLLCKQQIKKGVAAHDFCTVVCQVQKGNQDCLRHTLQFPRKYHGNNKHPMVTMNRCQINTYYSISILVIAAIPTGPSNNRPSVFPFKSEMNDVNQHMGALCIPQLHLVLL